MIKHPAKKRSDQISIKKEYKVVNMKNTQVQGLRGICLIMVLTYHFCFRFFDIFSYEHFHFIIFDNMGSFAVTVFLFISTFYMLPRKKQTKFGYSGYLIKKIKRIWLPYAAAVVIVFSVVTLSNYPYNVSIKDFVINIFMLQGVFRVEYVDGAHWYVTLLVFSIILIGMLKKLKLADKWYVYCIWMALTAVLMKLKVPVVPNILGYSYVGIISAGMTIGHFGGDLRRLKKEKLWIIVLAVSVGYTFFAFDYIFVIKMILAAAVSLLAFNQKLGFLSFKPLIFIGNISYSVYLIHQYIGYAIMYELMLGFGEFYWWFPLVALATAFLLGLILYYSIENPIWLKMKKKAESPKKITSGKE